MHILVDFYIQASNLNCLETEFQSQKQLTPIHFSPTFKLQVHMASGFSQ